MLYKSTYLLKLCVLFCLVAFLVDIENSLLVWLLRICISTLSVMLSVKYFKANWTFTGYLIIILAILFNPIISIPDSRSLLKYVDLIICLLLLVSFPYEYLRTGNQFSPFYAFLIRFPVRYYPENWLNKPLKANSENLGGLPYHLKYCTNWVALEEFPKNIQESCNSFINEPSLGWENKVKYITGQILDFEGLTNDIEYTNRFGYPTYKYYLLFQVDDLSIGLDKYQLYISFDQYGQLQQVNWPNDFYLRKKMLDNISSAKKKATLLASLSGLKIHFYNLECVYISSSALRWKFIFNGSRGKKVECTEIREFNCDDSHLHLQAWSYS